MSSQEKICVVTGAQGWVGRCVSAELRSHGWQVRIAARQPAPESMANGFAVRFQLGQPVPPELCAGASALVHCAYDFQARTPQDQQAINVRGTEDLLDAANAAGINRIVVISTMSAFDGCVSLYGKSKLSIEAAARQAGAMVLRPGLVYDHGAGGMFGSLVAQVQRARLLPLFGGGAQPLYLVHQEDLAAFIQRFCAGEVALPPQPLTTAHPQLWTFRQILEAIAGRLGRKLTFFPMPWRPVWAALRIAELCGLRLNFRSDSLVSLMNQNPHPDFSLNAQYGLECRPFRIEEVLGIPNGP
jgi:nucleoside-diphosphate-sugar epimerase